MKYLLIMFILSFSNAYACPVQVEFSKNQSEYNLSEYSYFLKELKNKQYQIVGDDSYVFKFNFRLKKRVTHYNSEKFKAVVAVDILNEKDEMISHSVRSGKTSNNKAQAYSKKSFEKALLEIIDELHLCNY